MANKQQALLSTTLGAWPFGEGLWVVPRWAAILLVLVIVLPSLWFLLQRAWSAWRDRDA